MKAVALFLLLANLLYLAWSQWLAQPDAPPPAPPAERVPRLQLADEAQSTPPGPLQPDAPSASAGEESATSATAPAGEGSSAPAQLPSSTAGGELLSGVTRCVSIGAFRNLEEITQASTTLREAGYEPRTRVAEGDVWQGLWVHVGGLPTRADAQKAMSVLKQHGVTDAYIMPSAEGANEISLGIFSETGRAQRRMEEVRALGFKPDIADRTRKGTVYWIDIDLKPTDGFIDPATFQKDQKDSGKIVRLEVQACPVAGQSAG
jgi:hypothetical protein